MKALTKIAATVAAIPVAGLIALTSAGAAQALTCDPGYVPVTFNGIQSCSPTGTGGTGGGGNVSTGTGGSTTPGQAGGIVNGGSGGGPIPGYVAPAPAPIYVAPQPAPAPVPAPVPAYKAPVQQTPVKIPAPAQNSIPVAPSVPAPIPAGNAGDASVDSSSGSSVDAIVTEAAPVIAPAAPADVAVTNEVEPDDATASASPSASAAPTEKNAIDAAQASETQSALSALAFFVLGVAVISAFAALFLVRHILARKEIRKSF